MNLDVHEREIVQKKDGGLLEEAIEYFSSTEKYKWDVTTQEWKELYGLYKLALSGACNVQIPSTEDKISQPRQEAWFRSSFSFNSSATEEKFVTLLEAVRPNWRSHKEEIDFASCTTARAFKELNSLSGKTVNSHSSSLFLARKDLLPKNENYSLFERSKVHSISQRSPYSARNITIKDASKLPVTSAVVERHIVTEDNISGKVKAKPSFLSMSLKDNTDFSYEESLLNTNADTSETFRGTKSFLSGSIAPIKQLNKNYVTAENKIEQHRVMDRRRNSLCPLQHNKQLSQAQFCAANHPPTSLENQNSFRELSKYQPVLSSYVTDDPESIVASSITLSSSRSSNNYESTSSSEWIQSNITTSTNTVKSSFKISTNTSSSISPSSNNSLGSRCADDFEFCSYFFRKSGYIFKQTFSTLYNSWNTRYMVLDGFMLKYYLDSNNVKPRATIPLQRAILEGLFSPEDNVGLGLDLWTFTVRWQAESGREFDKDENLSSVREWSLLHAGTYEEEEARSWFIAIQSAIRSCNTKPPLLNVSKCHFPCYFPLNEIISLNFSHNEKKQHISHLQKDLFSACDHWRYVVENVKKDLDGLNKDWDLVSVSNHQRILINTKNNLKWKCVLSIPASQQLVLHFLFESNILSEWRPGKSYSWKKVKLNQRNEASKHIEDLIVFQHPLLSNNNDSVDKFIPGLSSLINMIIQYRLLRTGWRDNDNAIWICATSLSAENQSVKNNGLDDFLSFLLNLILRRFSTTKAGDYNFHNFATLQVEYVAWKIDAVTNDAFGSSVVNCVLSLAEKQLDYQNCFIGTIVHQLMFQNLFFNFFIHSFFNHLTVLRNFLTSSKESDFSSLISQKERNFFIETNLEIKEEDLNMNKNRLQMLLQDSDDLSHTQIRLLNRLLRRFVSCGMYHSDVMRFLIANDWKLRETESAIIKYLQWRCDFAIDVIDTRHVQNEISKRWAYVHGTDKLNRPCIVILGASCFPMFSNKEELKHFIIYLMEQAIKKMDNEVDQVVILLDGADCGFRNFPFDVFFELLPIFLCYYPERLGLLLIFRASWAVKLMWLTVKPFLNENTISKIIFLSNDLKSMHNSILKFFDISRLPKCFKSLLENNDNEKN